MGIGNFLEVGPLDVNLKPRNSTWLQKADLIFVVSLLLQTPHAHLRPPLALAVLLYTNRVVRLMAAGQPGRRRVQLRGGRQPAGDD